MTLDQWLTYQNVACGDDAVEEVKATWEYLQQEIERLKKRERELVTELVGFATFVTIECVGDDVSLACAERLRVRLLKTKDVALPQRKGE